MDNLDQQLNTQLLARNIISKGWSGMLFLLFFMMLSDLVNCGMNNDFSLLTKDPGISGLWFIAIMTMVNVCVQIAIQTFDNRIFRWVVFGLTVVYTLLFVAHQAIHIAAGEGIDIHFFLDLTHHILGVWAAVFAYKWAKN
jgi:hypothetical protein